MDIIIYYILLGVIAYFGCRIVGFYWSKGYDTRKQKRDAKKQEKLKWQYVNVNKDNQLLKKIIQYKNIMFSGDPRQGKTITANLVAHFIWENQKRYDKKNKRYNKYMKPEYLKELNQLQENESLPIYSNMEMTDFDTGAKTQDLWPYLTQTKKTVENCVHLIDEVNKKLPKELYYTQSADPKPEIERVSDYGARHGHYDNSWIIMTDQSGQNVWIGLRNSGYVNIKALGTMVSMAKGKVVRVLRNIENWFRPAWLSVNIKNYLDKFLFPKDKICGFFQLLLPASWGFVGRPEIYYSRKQKINKEIKFNYQRYLVHLLFEGKEYYLRFTNNDIFKYDHREYRKDYTNNFNESGERKGELNAKFKDGIKALAAA